MAIALIVIVLFIGAALLNGWALSILWAWFFVPVFGLPVLSVAQAIGISMVVGYLTSHYQHIPKDKHNEYVYVVSIFAKPLLTVAIGWIVKSFL